MPSGPERVDEVAHYHRGTFALYPGDEGVVHDKRTYPMGRNAAEGAAWIFDHLAIMMR